MIYNMSRLKIADQLELFLDQLNEMRVKVKDGDISQNEIIDLLEELYGSVSGLIIGVTTRSER